MPLPLTCFYSSPCVALWPGHPIEDHLSDICHLRALRRIRGCCADFGTGQFRPCKEVPDSVTIRLERGSRSQVCSPTLSFRFRSCLCVSRPCSSFLMTIFRDRQPSFSAPSPTIRFLFDLVKSLLPVQRATPFPVRRNWQFLTITRFESLRLRCLHEGCKLRGNTPLSMGVEDASRSVATPRFTDG